MTIISSDNEDLSDIERATLIDHTVQREGEWDGWCNDV